MLGKRPRTSTIGGEDEGDAGTSSSHARKRTQPELSTKPSTSAERVAQKREELLEEKRTELARLLSEHDTAVRRVSSTLAWARLLTIIHLAGSRTIPS